ncbi:uncharacterized protein LOC113497236 [Trichoplusia ni]|uniref:Uncharacterized protein LOC113497236 n=1 Tax=Trichoplusia ni TaxID=7111 RepID=A0A7E5VVZ3_TRINI|nr:uncharacterized protein LOC113497236 [Trichoplusia ni]
MLVVYLITFVLYHSGNCFKILPTTTYNENIFQCVTSIIHKYFTEGSVITHVGNNVDDRELLQAINNANIITMVSRQAPIKLIIPHEAYLISAYNASHFAKNFKKLTRESAWNPLARFLILVEELKETELNVIFDTLLRWQVINVVVVKSTEDPLLYTYNPYDNYNCGKRYDTVINYGKCSHAHSLDLYPEKAVTGLRNCTLDVVISHWPPFTIVYSRDSNNISSELAKGLEPYLLRLMGETQGFKVNILDDYDSENISTVSSDMRATGTLKKLQDHEVDAVIGGMLLIPSRALAFSFIDGHLGYIDEIRFIVKRASFMPDWKYLYLEFNLTIWALLILCILLYSVLLILLLRPKDKTYVVFWVLESLILHGRNVRSRQSVKYVLILWVWFSYFMSTFYQSSLVSLTTNPLEDFQISTEEDIAKYKLKPCFSKVMGVYYIESIQSNDEFFGSAECSDLLDSVKSVMESDNLYTIMQYGAYSYHKEKFYDQYGRPRIMSLPKPYSKVIYATYVDKGFPILHTLRCQAFQLRENGIVAKILKDMYYLQRLKHIFQAKEFRGSLLIPWRVYGIGYGISVAIFILEIICHNEK